MPRLASFEVDREALAVVGEWMDRMELVSRKQETEVQTGE